MSAEYFEAQACERREGADYTYRIVVPVRQNCSRHPRHIEAIQISGDDSGRGLCISPSCSYHANIAKRVRFPATAHD